MIPWQSFLFSVCAGLTLGVVSSLIDYFVKSLRRPALVVALCRAALFVVLLAPLLAWVGRPQPQLSMAPNMIQATYGKKSGLVLRGSFADRGNDAIYLLTKRISDGADRDVWTAAAEVGQIAGANCTWQARLHFTEEVKAGDIYLVRGLMTRVPFALGSSIRSADLNRIKGAFSETLEIQLAGVVDE